ncbi:hypothetical protein GGI04_003300 [Coemansia thaxteri]|nr:hypothetical protein GGI04_003300 [Coemansia thaxteri]
MSVVWRAGLAAQICYMLLHIMLAVHIMSIAGVVSRKFDSAVSCYYGPAAGTLAFMATYRVIPTLSFYPFAYLTVLPAATLALVIAAAARASKAARVAGGRITVRIGEDEDVDANVSLDDYSAFAKTTAALFLLWCLPWMIWSHTPSLPQWAVVLAIAPLRARGVHSFVLTRTSPALSMQVVEEEDDEDKDTSTHSHQD